MSKPAIQTKAAEMVTKAVAAIVLDDPFYGYLLLRQEIKSDDKTPTACTNGKQIRYNPEFVAKMTIPQLKGLLKHEVMHVAYMHTVRRQQRDPERWNIAGDLVINAMLKKAGVDLPEGGLIDEKYADFSTEHVYNMLPPTGGGSGFLPGQKPGNGGFPPPWNFGEVEDDPNASTEQERQRLEEDIKLDVIQAHNTAKIMGKLPVGIERLIEQARESKMPWRSILAKFFNATAKDNASWRRPNRRFLAHDIYLPSLHNEALGPLVIGIDTSGSIADKELTDFFGCINGILKQTKPESVHLVACDAAVHNTKVFLPKDYPITFDKYKPRGGGGTDFCPVFDYVKQRKLKPVALLYLTDLLGTFPSRPPSYPTIWCSTTNGTAPFGKTIQIA